MPHLPTPLALPPMGAAFAGDEKLPATEIKGHFDRARARYDQFIRRSMLEAQISGIADWLSFGLGSIITVLAGRYGIKTDSDQSGAPEDAIGNLRKLGHRAHRVITLVGVLAALASVFTGLSNRLQARADANHQAANELFETYSAARRDVINAGSAAEAEIALEQLDRSVLTHQ